MIKTQDPRTKTMAPKKLTIQALRKRLSGVKLLRGTHRRREEGMCAMEMVSWLAGEKHTDHPVCACPVISAFMRRWNDSIFDTPRRTRLLTPLLPYLLNTRSTPEVEEQRRWLAVDWAVREQAPALLRIVNHADLAERLEKLEPIVSRATSAAAALVARSVNTEAWSRRGKARTEWRTEYTAAAAVAAAAAAAAAVAATDVDAVDAAAVAATDVDAVDAVVAAADTVDTATDVDAVDAAAAAADTVDTATAAATVATVENSPLGLFSAEDWVTIRAAANKGWDEAYWAARECLTASGAWQRVHNATLAKFGPVLASRDASAQALVRSMCALGSG
jgi:hypothetical protein